MDIQNQKNIKLDFYGIGVEVKSSNDDLNKLIESDFHYFAASNLDNCSHLFKLEIHKQNYEQLIPSGLVASKQSENSISYDDLEIRYNDYYGKALSVMNYAKESAVIYYQDETFIHELVYLIILSRTGKLMDQKGLHKVHACGVNKADKNLILMMPSKGGKSTIFCDLLKDKSINIISDDTPVINKKGEILPFPLRVGLTSLDFIQEVFPEIDPNKLPLFKRKNYEAKYLVPLNQLDNKIQAGRKNILINGKRSTFKEPKLVKIGSLKMLFYTLEHMVVGLGLPMIVEYFLRNNLRDHLLNLSIFFSRLRAAIQLVIFSENYTLYCSDSRELNKKIILDLLNHG